jgi:nicotinamidase-related amidase
LSDQAVLLVVDVQYAFDDPDWGARNNPHAEVNIATLLDEWRASERPVVHVRHRNPGSGSRFSDDTHGQLAKPEVKAVDPEPILIKEVNSAFIGTDLEERLRKASQTHVVIVGLTTDHCISTTARMGSNLGFAFTVVSDATATFERTSWDGGHWTAQEMHDSALASLHGEFATIATTKDTLQRLY